MKFFRFFKTIVIFGERKQQRKGSKHLFVTSKGGSQSLLLPTTKWLKMLIPFFLSLAQLFTSPLVVAQDFVFQPKLVTGIMHYKYELGAGYKSIFRDSVKLEGTLPFFSVGATLAFPTNSFMSASFQMTTKDDIDESRILTVGNPEEPANYQKLSLIRNTELERQNLSVSFGHKMADNFSVFLGYQRGKTEYDWIEYESYQYDYHIGTVLKYNDFVTEGLFLGTAYTLPVNWKKVQLGVLALHLTVAKLNGEIITNRIHIGAGSEATIRDQRREEQIFSKTAKFQLGISWNGRFTEQWPGLSYGISLDGSWYNFDPQRGTFSDDRFDDGRWHQILNLAPYEVKETVYSVSFLLRYRF